MEKKNIALGLSIATAILVILLNIMLLRMHIHWNFGNSTIVLLMTITGAVVTGLFYHAYESYNKKSI